MVHVEDTQFVPQSSTDPNDCCVATVENWTIGVQDLCGSSRVVELASNTLLCLGWLKACETLPGFFSSCCACKFLFSWRGWARVRRGEVLFIVEALGDFVLVKS